MSAAARAHALRFYGAVALGVVAVSVGVVLQGRARELPHDPLAPLAQSAAIVRWCAEGLEPIPGGGCFAAPAAAQKTEAVLLYLHGRYSPESVGEELERQARVARLATARGYAVLAFRGSQGQCSDPQLATWWCWPSNERNVSDGAGFVGRWAPSLDEVERRVGKRRRVLLGFSNGAYFAAMIGSRALLPFDAISIAHGGPVAPMHPAGPTPPLLLISAEDDPSDPEMQHLASDLIRESWPHVLIARDGAHGLPEWDIEMSLTFFDRTRTERLPLSPPLAPPHIPHPHDASASDADPPPLDVPVPVPVPDPSPSSPSSPSSPAPDPSTPVLDPPP